MPASLYLAATIGASQAYAADADAVPQVKVFVGDINQGTEAGLAAMYHRIRAGEIEANFAQAGMAVFSNAKNYRMEPDVPLLIPEVNADHAGALSEQRKRRGWPGSIVTNANCSATPLVMALKPLQQAFGVRKVMVTTLQAISGAGYPGLPSYDIFDNAIPYIGGEEEKVEKETRKMLGTWEEGKGFSDAPIVVSAQCNRVATREGHLECASVELENEAD